MSHRGLILLAGVLLMACTTTREVAIPKPVIVPGPAQYVPLPTELTADCDAAPQLRDGMKGGELLAAARAWQRRATCRDAQIDSIQRLQPR